MPADSPIKSLQDIKGKRIGVASLASSGTLVARATAAELGLNPDKDVAIIAIGEGGAAAGLVRSKEVDALCLYDTQYALMENAGLQLRSIPNRNFDRFPGNRFLALEETIAERRAEAVALGQGYAKGTVFAIANPEAAVRILWEQFPQTKATGKDEAQALVENVKTLEARIVNFRLDQAGVTQWGEDSMANYQAYLDFLLKQGINKEPVKAADIVTNDLVPEINAFDGAQVAADSRAPNRAPAGLIAEAGGEARDAAFPIAGGDAVLLLPGDLQPQR